MKRDDALRDLMAERILAVSGGADSMYLLHLYGHAGGNALIAHVDHGTRGKESDEDMRFVESIAKSRNLPVRVKRAPKKGRDRLGGQAFEERARDFRYTFLKELKEKSGAGKILLAHTADDQVETVLMRIFEGAGISGLKGIPRKTAEGIERPMLDTWREEIVEYLRKHKIPYRVDKSNFDTRFERNWVRHVMIPMLEKQYGKSVKKRIFTLGERFREIDEFLESAARRWIKGNVRGAANAKQGPVGGKKEAGHGKPIGVGEFRFRRKPFKRLPSLLRKKITQIVCFERIGLAPNERLIAAMDRLILSGGPSEGLSVGKGAILKCRYDEAIVDLSGMKARATGGKGKDSDPRAWESPRGGKRLPLNMNGPGLYRIEYLGPEGAKQRAGGPVGIRWDEKGRTSLSGIKRLAEGDRAAAFDRGDLLLPLSVRALRAGDRIRPFGLGAEKKIKEILIDRKVPADKRWGRPVVCDANGKIIWIPGVVRSDHALVTSKTRQTVVLRLEIRYLKGNN